MTGWGSTRTLDVSGTPTVPFSRLVAVEMRKMSDTRAGKWLLVVIAVITLLAVGLLLVFAPSDAQGFKTFVGTSATPQGLLLPVLGVLLVTGEWAQRAALTTFTLVPNRGRIIAAKVAAAVLFGLAAIVLALVLAALATLVGGASDPWDGYGLSDVVKFAALQTTGVLQGLAFGMLFLNSAAAIVTYFVVPIGFTVVTGIVPGLQDLQPWIDLGTSQNPLFDPGGLSGEELAQLASSLFIWVVVPMALGAWRMLRAEVK